MSDNEVCYAHSGLVTLLEAIKNDLSHVSNKLEEIEKSVNEVKIRLAFTEGKSKILGSISGFISGIFSGAAFYLFK